MLCMAADVAVAMYVLLMHALLCGAVQTVLQSAQSKLHVYMSCHSTDLQTQWPTVHTVFQLSQRRTKCMSGHLNDGLHFHMC